jgi:hypothetical protein
MMSGMPLETCWALNKLWNNKFCYKVASCWLFPLIHTMMHESMNMKFINLTLWLRPFLIFWNMLCKDAVSYVKMLSIAAIIFIQRQMNQCVRSTGWMTLGGNTEALEQQPVPLPLCPPKSHMEWPVTQPVAAVRGQQLPEPWHGPDHTPCVKAGNFPGCGSLLMWL